jgi:hypothetical protein
MFTFARRVFGCAVSFKEGEHFFFLWLFVFFMLVSWSFLYAAMYESFITPLNHYFYDFKLSMIPRWIELKIIVFFAFFLFSMGFVMPLMAKLYRDVDISYLLMRWSINAMAFMITTLFFYPLIQLGFSK